MKTNQSPMDLAKISLNSLYDAITKQPAPWIHSLGIASLPRNKPNGTPTIMVHLRKGNPLLDQLKQEVLDLADGLEKKPMPLFTLWCPNWMEKYRPR